MDDNMQIEEGNVLSYLNRKHRSLLYFLVLLCKHLQNELKNELEFKTKYLYKIGFVCLPPDNDVDFKTTKDRLLKNQPDKVADKNIKILAYYKSEIESKTNEQLLKFNKEISRSIENIKHTIEHIKYVYSIIRKDYPLKANNNIIHTRFKSFYIVDMVFLKKLELEIDMTKEAQGIKIFAFIKEQYHEKFIKNNKTLKRKRYINSNNQWIGTKGSLAVFIKKLLERNYFNEPYKLNSRTSTLAIKNMLEKYYRKKTGTQFEYKKLLKVPEYKNNFFKFV